MPTARVIHIQPSDDDTLAQGVVEIQRELRLPLAFPPEVEAAAAQAAANPRLPDLDRTDIPLVTIDPPGSMDLDQALFQPGQLCGAHATVIVAARIHRVQND